MNQNDDVYVFQPRKGESVKVSYHESGQRHLKIGRSEAMYVMHLDSPEWILHEEPVWEKSFENFSRLLPYTGQDADEILEIDIPAEGDEIVFAQVSIGRFFDPKPQWCIDGATLATLVEKTFIVPISPSHLSLCVRVLRLAHSTQARL